MAYAETFESQSTIQKGIASAASWIAESGQSGSQFGNSIANAGDVNGDGYDDVIVGASFFTDGEDREGKVFVYYGGPNGPSQTPSWTAQSDQAHAEFGVSVAGAGDVNGDGYDDVLIGAHFYDSGQSNEGAAFLYYGGPNGLAATPAWVGEGNQLFAFYGISVAGAGDVNGDGYDDIIVGAHYYDAGELNEGAAFVYHGSPTGLPSIPNWTGQGNQIQAEYGISVAGVGDVNNDGYDDVAVGANKYDNPQLDEGRVFVYYGSPTGLSTSANWTGESNQGDAQFGRSVAGAGDVNGDGYDDLIVGAYRYNNGETNEGRAYVYLGSATGLLTTPDWIVEGNQEWAYFGYSVAGVGDVNNDGYDDVLVGAVWYDDSEVDEGAAFLYPGSADGLTTIEALYLPGGQANSGMGAVVAAGGDANGDGYSDVLMSALHYSNGEPDEGRVFWFPGTANGVELGPQAPVITTDGGNGPGADFMTESEFLTLDGTKGPDGVVIRVNNSTAGVTILGPTSWTYTGPIAEGENLMVVTAVDADNLPSIPDIINVTLDTTAPNPPVITTDGGNGQGQDFVTNNEALILEGTAESNLKAIHVNGSTEGVSYTPGQTDWQYQSTLTEGGHSFDVVAVDMVDNESSATRINITLDTVPPAAPIITTNGGNGPGEDFLTNLASLTIEGSTEAGTHEIRVNDSLDRVLFAPGHQLWSYEAQFAPGDNTFVVSARDEAGNMSLPVSITITYDPNLLDPPVITTDGGNGPGEDFHTNVSGWTIEGTTANGTSAIRVNGAATGVSYAAGAATWSYTADLNEGANLISVTAVNSQGTPSFPATLVITVDTTAPPPPTIITDGGKGPGANFATNQAQIDLRGTTVAETEVISVNGATAGVEFTSGQPNWTLPVTLIEGGNHFSVTAADGFGNTSAAAEITITLDTVAPAAPIITTDGGNGPGEDFATLITTWGIEGTADDDTAVILVNESSANVALDPATGIWTYPVTLAPGNNHFEVVAADAAGNQSPAATMAIEFTEGSTLTAEVSLNAPTQVLLGQPINVSGGIGLSPNAPPGLLTGLPIRIRYRLEGITEVTRSATTRADHLFGDSYTPSIPGVWTVEARFDGAQGLPESPWSPRATVHVVTEPLGPFPDVNGDNLVNAVDVQLMINALLGLIDLGEAADVNRDGVVDTVDLQIVINAVLSGNY
jgi:hypothetical protein